MFYRTKVTHYPSKTMGIKSVEILVGTIERSVGLRCLQL